MVSSGRSGGWHKVSAEIAHISYISEPDIDPSVKSPLHSRRISLKLVAQSVETNTHRCLTPVSMGMGDLTFILLNVAFAR